MKRKNLLTDFFVESKTQLAKKWRNSSCGTSLVDLVICKNAGGSSTTSATLRTGFLLSFGKSGLETALHAENFLGDLAEKSIKLGLRVRVVLVIIFGELQSTDSSLDLVEAILEQVLSSLILG